MGHESLERRNIVMPSRRAFLTAAGLAAWGVTAGGLVQVAPRRWLGSQVSLSAKDRQALIDFALSETKRIGCAYADVAITRRNDLAAPLTFRVRVDSANSWGVAECSAITKNEIARTVAQAVANAKIEATPYGHGPSQSTSPMTFPVGETYFASSQGAVFQSVGPATA
jgi:hypothetical protein